MNITVPFWYAAWLNRTDATMPASFYMCGEPSLFQISAKTPLSVAEPVYGWFMPVVVGITMITNIFIVIVLSRKHLRTPTNSILMAMAITEMLTGVITLPWMMYIYTFKGYIMEQNWALPEFWCKRATLFMENLPSIFHMSAVWLTVFLAVQRYIYVCLPQGSSIGTMGRTQTVIVALCVAAFVFELPKAYFLEFHSSPIEEVVNGTIFTKRVCYTKTRCWVHQLDPNKVYSSQIVLKVILGNLLPCIVLVIFTGILLKFLRDADNRRERNLLRPSRERLRLVQNHPSVPGPKRANSRKGGGGVYFQNTTKMLIVVIIFFVCTHLPYTVILLLHVFYTISGKNVTWKTEDYDRMNSALIITNALSIVQYPFNFAIYCSMSKQFRITVRQLFTRRRLFYEQNIPHTGANVETLIEKEPSERSKMSTRYSVILMEANGKKHKGLGFKFTWPPNRRHRTTSFGGDFGTNSTAV